MTRTDKILCLLGVLILGLTIAVIALSIRIRSLENQLVLQHDFNNMMVHAVDLLRTPP